MDKQETLAALDDALAALAAGRATAAIPGLPDIHRDRLHAAGVLGDWIAGRRAALAQAPDFPAPARTATGYALWSALSRAQIAGLDAKDAGRLQARGSERIPETNPVIARLAAQAGITVSAWFDAVGGA